MNKKEQLTSLPHQSLGEVIDKITILTRKVYFGEEEAYEELNYLSSHFLEHGELVKSIVLLAQMNFEIWNLENEIRKGGEDRFSLEEVGRRALKIRDLNKKRVKYKNKINQVSGLGFTEFKIKHRSQ